MRNRRLSVVLGLGILFVAACDDDSTPPTPAPAPAPAPVPAPTPTPDPAPAGPITLSGNISEDMTLSAGVEYVLSGAVFVTEGVTLQIEAGTTIYGESATNGALIVARGGRIWAEGTAEAPIVFTSDQEVGSRARGDWGGLIINGRAPLNVPGGIAEGEGDTGSYGGLEDDDDSGTLKYVRVEFAGTEFSPDNELNGIAFQGVGSSTIVDYIQVHFNKDDGVEFFGGTVDAKHVVCTGIADDSFDWTDGWRGRGQFWIARQFGDDADNGIEADNNGENNDLTPRSDPTLYNITLIGDPTTALGDESDIGMLLREGTSAEIGNAIVLGFKEGGLVLDHPSTYQLAASGDLMVKNSYFFNNGDVNFKDGKNREQDGSPVGVPVTEYMAARTGIHQDDPGLVMPFGSGDDFNPCPKADAPVLSGAAMPPNDGFFEPVNYIGACDTGDTWFAGWTNFVPN